MDSEPVLHLHRRVRRDESEFLQKARQYEHSKFRRFHVRTDDVPRIAIGRASGHLIFAEIITLRSRHLPAGADESDEVFRREFAGLVGPFEDAGDEVAFGGV